MKNKRKVGEFSEFTYEELMEKCKGKTKLKNTLNKIFDKYNDVCVFNMPHPYDVEEEGEFATKDVDHINMMIEDGCEDEIHNEGWDIERLEPMFLKRFEGFNWDFNEINDEDVIFVVDCDDYMRIGIHKKNQLSDGILDFMFLSNVHID